MRLALPALSMIETRVGQSGFQVACVAAGQAIPGSYWGDSEAGLIQRKVYIRQDTPLHSFLHEFCHALCMDTARLEALHTDAGGDDLEECAVCYLQLHLGAQHLDYAVAQQCADMDVWGFSFMSGSAAKWFSGLHDSGAHEARQWLQSRGLL